MTQDPNDSLDYTVDWSNVLAGGETISSATFTGGGLTTASPSFTNTTATVFLSGGAVDTVYRVSCRIITSAGRTYERSFNVRVAEL